MVIVHDINEDWNVDETKLVLSHFEENGFQYIRTKGLSVQGEDKLPPLYPSSHWNTKPCIAIARKR